MLLDKPPGLSSTQALQRVRRALQAEKAGHAGTLDPLATGMLPLCFGQATKACGTLLGRRKAYRATILLGARTDTGDAAGQVVAELPVPILDDGRVNAVLAGLGGSRLQLPPMYSALKRDGRPLYELARRGEEVEREPRPVTIETLVARARSERTLDIEVVCSKGTYVRVLGEEIAAGLGTLGHLGALRRLWVEPFDPAAMVSLEQIEADVAAGGTGFSWLLPVDCAFPDLPELRLGELDTLHLRQGRVLSLPAAQPGPAVWRAYDPEGGFLGLVERAPDGGVRVQRLFVAGAGTGRADANA